MNAAEWDREHLFRFRGQFLRAADPDTLVFLHDQGMSGRHETYVRIAGYNAPEGHTKAIQSRVEAQIRGLPGVVQDARWPFRFVSEQPERMSGQVKSFTRYVGTLYCEMTDGSLKNILELIA